MMPGTIGAAVPCAALGEDGPLARAWPELSTAIVADAGHSSHESGITEQLVAAMARIARTGSPVLPA